MPPNSSRLSRAWGVDFSRVRKEVSLGNRFLDWHSNVLLDCSFSDVEFRYGAPYYFVHRADLINLLLDTARETENVDVVTDCKVVSYDFEAPSVTTATGKVYECDLVVCADGIKSAVRDVINGVPCTPVDTGDVAYRILVPAQPLLDDPETRHLVEEPWAMHWLGPEGHAVGYPLRGGELYNIIIDVTHATDLGEPVGVDEWRSQAGNEELVERFKNWCPPVRKLCGLTGTYLKWKLADFPEPLRQWVHPNGKAALLGDACHPMMPYMAQGAAMATEDAATMAAALRKFHDPADLGRALRLYEMQRRPRASFVTKNTRILQEWLHLYDGEEQERRDELMKNDRWDNPVFWAFMKRRDWLFGHDASKLEAAHEVDDRDGKYEGNGVAIGEQSNGHVVGARTDLEPGIPLAPPFPPAKASVYLPEGVGVWKDNRRWEPSATQVEAYHSWRREGISL